jgi:4-hydroxybenzoate polyprenyltransferase
MGFAAAIPALGLITLTHQISLEGGQAVAETTRLAVDARWLPVLALYAGGVFWTLGYDTIYALQDLEDDAMVGVKSSARRLGANVRLGVGVFYLLAIVFASLAGLLAGLGPLFYVGLTGYAFHLLWQTRSVRPDDGPLALALFKSNREAGLVLLLAIILGSVQLPL